MNFCCSFLSSTKFCNGTTTTCDGLSQWGSQYLAQQGYDAFSILKYYYGQNIEIVKNAPIQDLGRSYPGAPLRLGSTGESVLVIKSMLNRISQSYPAIPKILPVTPTFDQSTENAVRTFQRVFNLTVDGVVGKATWYKMVYLFVGIRQLSELVSMGQQFESFSFQYPGLLRQGARGSDVAVLQYMLSLLAEFNQALTIISVDGVYGPATTNAVREYQLDKGLSSDGIVGQQTWYSIYGDYAGIEIDLSNDNLNFPNGDTVPASADAGYGRTSRQGQFQGTPMRLGQSDYSGVQLT